MVRLGLEVTILAERGDHLWRIADVVLQCKLFFVNFADTNAVLEYIKTIRADFIFYCSAYGEKPHQTDQKKIRYLNYDLPKNIFFEAIENTFSSFTYIGSYLEYSATQDPIKLSLARKGLITNPSLEYGFSKKMASDFFLTQADRLSLPVYVMRAFYVYGSFMAHDSVMGRFALNAAIKNKFILEPEICYKDFIYGQDFANLAGNIVMFLPKTQHLFEAGRGKIVSPDELIAACKLAMPHISEVKRPENMSSEDSICARTDASPGHNIWEKQTSLEDGIKKTLEWTKFNLIKYRGIVSEIQIENQLQDTISF